MMRTVRYNTDSTVRDTYPLMSLAMAAFLIGSVTSVIYFWLTGKRDGFCGEILGLAFFVFVFVGSYWKKFWTFILSVRATRLSRRYDYFELTTAEIRMLYTEPEWSGEIIDFMGLKRTFAHFDNEQDRVLFRLSR